MNRPSSNAETSASGLRPEVAARLTVLGVTAVWLALTSFQLTRAPGMNMDEAWVILSARGEWEPADPLSGMTRYSGPFPVLLLKALGTEHGLLVLRSTSLICNAAAVALIGLILVELGARGKLLASSLGLCGFAPAFLAMSRNGIEIGMFGPLLASLGTYGLLRATPRWALASGLGFGLLAYNHVVHAFLPLGMALSWLLVHRRLPPFAPWLALGFALGVAPRVLALVAYFDRGIEGSAAGYDFWAGVRDLEHLPRVLWDTLLGRTVYLRYVGFESVRVWPYLAAASLLLLPWWRRLADLPKSFWFSLGTTLLFCVLVTVGALYLTVRFFVFAAIGLSLCIGLAANETAQRWPRLKTPVTLLLGALVACQAFYAVTNFALPWYQGRERIAFFALGARSPRMTSWAFMPKTELVEELRRLSPDLIVSASASLDRPLRALLPEANVQLRFPASSEQPIESAVFVNYNAGRIAPRACLNAGRRRRCFSRPRVVGRHYVLYEL